MYKLYRGQTCLGTITPDPHRQDFPWFGGAFEPTPDFAAVRQLFEDEWRLLEEEDMDRWARILAEIERPGLRLVPSEGGRAITDFLIHLRGDDATWRVAEPDYVPPPSARVSGSHFAIALVSWCLAGPAVLGAFFMALIPLGIRTNWPIKEEGAHFLVLCPLPMLAWTCLGVMTVRWLQNRRCHGVWLVAGSLSGLASALFFAPLFFFYASAIPLALYLTHWHTRKP